jgi:hypothetical protein
LLISLAMISQLPSFRGEPIMARIFFIRSPRVLFALFAGLDRLDRLDRYERLDRLERYDG